MRLNYKKIIFILAFAAILTVGYSSLATAQESAGPMAGTPSFLDNIGLKAIFRFLNGILYFFGYVAGQLLNLAGNLTNWALDLNSHVIQNSTVSIGWTITRDIANLGFVLAIILMAFVTILRFETYDTKKMLWRLIVAALLVNFSLVIAGFFLDFADVLTDFFISKSSTNIGGAFANAFQAQRFLTVTQDASLINNVISGMSNGLIGMVVFAASLFFIVILTAIATISLLGLTAMLFVRYIWLTILLILVPLAWLFWIWPDLESRWKNWWSEFLKWTFFAPATSFFIYLALKIVQSGDNFSINNLTLNAAFNTGDTLGLTIQNIGGLVGQMVAVIGILIGGLMAAEKMGIEGAKMSLSMAKGFKSMATGGLVGAVWLGASAKPFKAQVEKSIEGLQKFGSGYGAIRRTITAPIRAIGNQISKVPNLQSKAIDQYKKEYESYSPKELKNMIPGVFSDDRRAAIMEILNEKNELFGEVQPYVPLLEKFNRKPIKNPAWDSKTIKAAEDNNTEQLAKTVSENLSKLKPDQIKNISWGDIFNNKLQGRVSNNAWDLIKKEITKQFVDEKINGNDMGNIYLSFNNDERDSFHNQMTDSMPGASLADKSAHLKNNNSGLYHFYQSNLAKNLGVNLEASTESAKQTESKIIKVEGEGGKPPREPKQIYNI